jgi:hypothetical protein
MLVHLGEMGLFCIELTGLARLEMQDIFLVETSLQILIRQDCYRQFGNQEMVHEMIDESERQIYRNLGHGILPIFLLITRSFDAVKEYNQ